MSNETPFNDRNLLALYLKGELDAASMQKLERRALDDPFLADAMEGYAKYGQAPGEIADFFDKEVLKKAARTAKIKDRRIQMVWVSAIAASLFLGAFYYLFINQKPSGDKSVEDKVTVLMPDQNKAPTVLRADTPAPAIAKIKRKIMPSTRINKSYAWSSHHPPQNRPENEPLAPKRDSAASRKPHAGPISSANGYAAIDKAVNRAQTVGGSQGISPATTARPLPFESPSQALEEVIVMKKSAITSPSQRSMTWRSYQSQFNEEILSPDGTQGTVVIGFSTGQNGEVQRMEVLRHLSYATDSVATSLVAKGPKKDTTLKSGEFFKIRIRFKAK